MKKIKDIILFILGVFFLLGTIIMIKKDISNTITFGIISAICLFFSKDIIIKLIKKPKKEDKKIQKQKIDNTEERNESIQKTKKHSLSEFIAKRKKLNEEKRVEAKKWIKVAGMGVFQVSEEYQKIRIRKQEIDFDKIISYEIIENGKVVTETTSNTFTFGNSKTKEKGKKHISPTKAVAGGLVGGGLGAVVGAGMGKTTTKGKTTHNIMTSTSAKTEDVEYCTEMKIEIKTNDIANPLITFEVMHSKDRKDSIYYKSSKETAHEIAAVLDIIISNNEKK